jgi:hypothetical protein
VTVKSEAIAKCKEMPVILVDRVVDKKRIIRQNGELRRTRGTRGWLTPKKMLTALQRADNEPT